MADEKDTDIDQGKTQESAAETTAQEQARITKLKNKYKELSDTFDLPVRTERMVALR